MKKKYFRPSIIKCKIDHLTSLWLMSEGGIPGNPPWANQNNKNQSKDPFKTEKA
ncbi:MAG: hypothetical protein PHT69_10270 [Bacteroidales bacterium]|nr:hypothetical protein [Bacteroidales bacterium]